MAFGAWQHCLNYILYSRTRSLEATVIKVCLGEGADSRTPASALQTLQPLGMWLRSRSLCSPMCEKEVGSDILQAELPLNAGILLFYYLLGRFLHQLSRSTLVPGKTVRVIKVSSMANSFPRELWVLGQPECTGITSGMELDQGARHTHQDKNGLPSDLESHRLLYLRWVIKVYSNLVFNTGLLGGANIPNRRNKQV